MVFRINVAKLTIKNANSAIVIQAQQILLEALASAVRVGDQVVPDDRTSNRVFDSCQAILEQRLSALPIPNAVERAEVVRVTWEIWNYLRYQMTDDDE